jgi:hypothetical protein
MLFWMFRLGPELSKDRIKSLWQCLNSDAPLAAADVFYGLRHSGGGSVTRGNVHGKLMRLITDETRKMLETSLVHRDRLT